jgi:hypothetical protein
MHLSHLGMSINISLWYKSDSCIHNHSQTAISTSSLLWNQQPSKCCFSRPDKLHIVAVTLYRKIKCLVITEVAD